MPSLNGNELLGAMLNQISNVGVAIHLTFVVRFNDDFSSYTKIAKGYYMNAKSVTNTGTTVFSDDDKNQYIYVLSGKKGSIYSIKELVDELDLPTNIDIKSISLSPNGDYLLFDVQDFRDDTFAVKIHFNNGIENYLQSTLKPIK